MLNDENVKCKNAIFLQGKEEEYEINKNSKIHLSTVLQ